MSSLSLSAMLAIIDRMWPGGLTLTCLRDTSLGPRIHKLLGEVFEAFLSLRSNSPSQLRFDDIKVPAEKELRSP